jgi:aminoglycoside 3-N-acetyltransferase
MSAQVIITAQEVEAALQQALEPGDEVMVHTALNPLGYFEAGINALIESLCHRVTPSGTIIMMADTRSFARTGIFSPNQPSETGLITEHFRQMPGVQRSWVPMVSFCAWGKNAKIYTQPYHSHLDETATISQLLQRDGKMMLLGIGYEKCTLFHLAEERYQSPYNFYKKFSGVLKREGLPDEPISQRYYVRKDLSIRKDPSLAGKMLEERRLANTIPLGNGKIRIFQARDFDECCMQALEKNPEAFIVKQEPL